MALLYLYCNILWLILTLSNKGWANKNLTKCLESKILANNLENGNKNPNIFFLCPWGKKIVVNHFSKPNSYQDMNLLRWSITDELWRLSVLHTFLNTCKVPSNTKILTFWCLLSFQTCFTTNVLPHGNRKKISASLFPFSIVFAKKLHAEHLMRLIFAHPLDIGYSAHLLI